MPHHGSPGWWIGCPIPWDYWCTVIPLHGPFANSRPYVDPRALGWHSGQTSPIAPIPGSGARTLRYSRFRASPLHALVPCGRVRYSVFKVSDSVVRWNNPNVTGWGGVWEGVAPAWRVAVRRFFFVFFPVGPGLTPPVPRRRAIRPSGALCSMIHRRNFAKTLLRIGRTCIYFVATWGWCGSLLGFIMSRYHKVD